MLWCACCGQYTVETVYYDIARAGTRSCTCAGRTNLGDHRTSAEVRRVLGDAVYSRLYEDRLDV